MLKLTWYASDGWAFACILAGICTFAILLYRELKHGHKLRRVSRIIASLLATASLCLIALKPGWETQGGSKHWILITPGTAPEKVDSIVKKYENSIIVYFSDSTGQYTTSELGSRESDLAILFSQLGKPQTLTLIGTGLPAQAWALLSDTHVEYISADKKSGFTSLHSPVSLPTGGAWHITGSYINETGEDAFLQLKTTGGIVVDSLTVPGHSTRGFTLRVTPQHSGGQQIRLSESKTGKQKIDEISLYAFVRPAHKLRLLVLTAAPSFETNSFKNWAARAGHAVTVRTGVSRAIYKYQWLNTAQALVGTLTPGALAVYDWVWLDAETLSGLSEQEWHALQDAVLRGMGVWVGLDDAPIQGSAITNTRLAPWHAAPLLADSTALLHVRWNYGDEPVQALLPPVTLQVQCAGMQQPLLQTQERVQATVAAYLKQGAGAWGVHVPLRTYTWLLQGQQKEYDSYWAAVLTTLARQPRLGLHPSEQTPQIVYIDEPIYLQSNGANRSPLVVLAPDGNRFTLYPKQDVEYTGRSEYSFWPRQAGWYHATIMHENEMAEMWIYVRSAGEDKALAALERTQIAREEAIKIRKDVLAPKQDVLGKTTTPLSVWWFWAAFLLSAGYLWLERKL